MPYVQVGIKETKKKMEVNMFHNFIKMRLAVIEILFEVRRNVMKFHTKN